MFSLSKKKNAIKELKFEFKGIILVGIAIYILLSLFNQPQDPYLLNESKIGFIGSFFVKIVSTVAGSESILITLYILYTVIGVKYKRAFLD